MRSSHVAESGRRSTRRWASSLILLALAEPSIGASEGGCFRKYHTRRGTVQTERRTTGGRLPPNAPVKLRAPIHPSVYHPPYFELAKRETAMLRALVGFNATLGRRY